MSETKWTEGPWTYIPSTDKRSDGYVVAGEVTPGAVRPPAICRVTSNAGPTRQKANANLIAAAPELYEACETFIRQIRNGEKNMTVSFDLMEAAIKKARGEQ
jgi:hypothetical protein